MHFLKSILSSILAAAASAHCGPEKMDGFNERSQNSEINEPSQTISQATFDAAVTPDVVPGPNQTDSQPAGRTHLEFRTTDSVVPIARINVISKSGINHHTCLATFVAGGFLLTAAHCLGQTDGLSECPQQIEIKWLQKKQSLRLGIASQHSHCDEVFSEWKADSNPTDIALIRLKMRGAWPKASLSLSREELNLGVPISILDPITASEEFTFQKGKSLELLGSQFTSSILSQKGSSGGPVFALSDAEDPRLTFPAKFYGLHVGTDATTTRSQHIRSIRQFIKNYLQLTTHYEETVVARNNQLAQALGVNL